MAMNRDTLKESEATKAFNAMIDQIYKEEMEKVEAVKSHHMEALQQRLAFDAAKEKCEEEKEEMEEDLSSLETELEFTKQRLGLPDESSQTTRGANRGENLSHSNAKFLAALAVFQSKQERRDTKRQIKLSEEEERLRMAQASQEAMKRVNEMRRLAGKAKELGDLKAKRLHHVSRMRV